MNKICLVVLVLLALVGCGGGDEEEAGPQGLTTQPVNCQVTPERCR